MGCWFMPVEVSSEAFDPMMVDIVGISRTSRNLKDPNFR